LGVLYDEMGEKDAALEHYQRALSILKLRLGEHFEYGMSDSPLSGSVRER
jgi:hypothetical protein